MDRRTFLFIALSVAIIVAYQELVLKRFQPPPGVESASVADGSTPEPTISTRPVEGKPADGVAIDGTEAAPAKPLQGRRVRIETPLYVATLNTAGGRIESFTLSRYPTTVEPGSPPLELVVPTADGALPLGLELAGENTWSDARTIYETTASDQRLGAGQEATVELRGAGPGGGEIVKKLTFSGDDYPITLEATVPALAALPPNLATKRPDGQGPTIGVIWSKGLQAHAVTGRAFEGAAAFVAGKLDQTTIESLKDTPKNLDGPVAWAGVEDHYFLSAVVPDHADQVALRAHRAGGLDSAVTGIDAKVLTVREASAPGPSRYTIFLGPKDRAVLDAVGHDLARSLNLGWFGAISLFLLKILNLSHHVTGNYGLDIIVLTVLVKLAFLPLTRKSFESMREMQKLQPQMARIREKYKDDSQQMNQELMELYKRHKVNPLGGCLPMVLQIPVFFGLYQALASAIELRQAPFVGWITDLAAPERLEILGWGVPVLTLLLGVSMFAQQKMAPPAGDPAQQRIMMFMPIVFTYMFIGFPAGLTLYWLTNNVITIAQQYFILRRYPPVQTT